MRPRPSRSSCPSVTDGPAPSVDIAYVRRDAVDARRACARVDALTGSYVDGSRSPRRGRRRSASSDDGGTWFSVVPQSSRCRPTAKRSSTTCARCDAPFGQVLVGGQSAALVDSKQRVVDRLPLADRARRA